MTEQSERRIEMDETSQGPKTEREPYVLPAKDRARYEDIINGLIRWCNADNEDAITLSRSQVCVIRDGIEDDRRIAALKSSGGE